MHTRITELMKRTKGEFRADDHSTLGTLNEYCEGAFSASVDASISAEISNPTISSTKNRNGPTAAIGPPAAAVLFATGISPYGEHERAPETRC